MEKTQKQIKKHALVQFYIIEQTESGFKKTQHSGLVADVFNGGFIVQNSDFKNGKCIPSENYIRTL